MGRSSRTVQGGWASHSARYPGVTTSRLTPFEGPVWDREGKLRIEHGVVPPLLELQRMHWLESSVEELNPLPEG